MAAGVNTFLAQGEVFVKQEKGRFTGMFFVRFGLFFVIFLGFGGESDLGVLKVLLLGQGLLCSLSASPVLWVNLFDRIHQLSMRTRGFFWLRGGVQEWRPSGEVYQVVRMLSFAFRRDR